MLSVKSKMAYKTLNKILIFIILSLLVNRAVNGQKFIPGPRVGHTATLLGGKIYYIGGVGLSAVDLTAADFFYLDEKFEWVDLKSRGTKFPVAVYHTSDIGGAKDSIFIIGGAQLAPKSLINVHKFDAKTNAITEPTIRGLAPVGRRGIRSVSSGGKIYMLGGINYNNIIIDGLDILDTINLNWETGSLVNAPLPRYFYTATLVNEVIYYIGGIKQEGTSRIYVLMSDIWQYDIKGNAWSLKTATAAKTLPGPRAGHSAVLVNGKICIYGGIYQPVGALRLVPPTEQIAILDTTTLVWSIPPLQDPNIPSLAFHTATLIDKLILVAFGNITNLPGGSVHNDKFYLFDFGEPNIKWKSFTAQEIGKAKASQSPGTTSSTSDNAGQPQSSALVIGLPIGLIVAGIVVFSLVYIHRKKNKKNESVSAGRGPDVFPPDDEHYPVHQYSPQFARQYQYSKSQEDPHSHTSTLTEHFPSQFSTLPPSQERFSQYSSNYSSEFKTLPPLPPMISPTIYRTNQQVSNYSPGSKTSSPPPPPPKTLPTTFDIHAKQVSNYSPGSETSSPPPPPPKTLPTTFDIHAKQASNYSPGSETSSPPLPPPKTSQTTLNIHGTNQQPFNYSSGSETSSPPPSPSKALPTTLGIHSTNQQASNYFAVNASQTTFNIHGTNQQPFNYSPGSETSSPPPSPSKALPTTLDIHSTNQQASNYFAVNEIPPPPPPETSQTTFNIHGTNQQPSIYSPGSETSSPPPSPSKALPTTLGIHSTNQQASNYFTVNEIPPPPPPKTSQTTFNIHGTNQQPSIYSLGSETSSPPPSPSKALPTTLGIHSTIQQASNYFTVNEIPPPPPPKTSQTTFNIHGTNQQPSIYSLGSETSSPPPSPSKALPTTLGIHPTNQQASNYFTVNEIPPPPPPKTSQTTFNIHRTNQQPSIYSLGSETSSPPPSPSKALPTTLGIHSTIQQASNYFTVNEIPPPPPPKTPQTTFNIHGTNQQPSIYSLGSETSSPPPSPSKVLPTTLGIHSTIQQASNYFTVNEIPPPPPPKTSQTTFNIHATNQQPSIYFQGSEIPPPPPSKTPPITFNIHGTNQQAY